MAKPITSHTELIAYQKAYDAAMQIYEMSKSFPKEETFSLTDQIRRSSRSVCANLAEAWRKRRYQKAFVSKLCEVEGECAETQVWLQFCTDCKYADIDSSRKLYAKYNEILATIVGMINHPDTWTIDHDLYDS